jgi:hypothetical protein
MEGCDDEGYSRDGLKLVDVQRAFAEAERPLGTRWKLKGRGHCRRVTLPAHYSRWALDGASRCWERVTQKDSGSRRRLVPLAIVHRAAHMMGVSPDVFISCKY